MIKFLNEIKRLDEKVAQFVGNNLKLQSFRHFFKLFEYIFHGVPWFIGCIVFLFYKNKILSESSALVLKGP